MAKIRQTKLTRFARSQPCTVQIFPYCNMDDSTTVLAHAPCEDKAMGIKSPDFWGAHCCSTCHDIVDGKMKTELSNEEIFRCHMRGVYRTQKRVIEAGLDFN